uniref:Uncharacterized protein n=1 Tax=Arundo donax TaxID=35708 RepID=A0A0A9BR05_ARUDO
MVRFLILEKRSSRACKPKLISTKNWICHSFKSCWTRSVNLY